MVLGLIQYVVFQSESEDDTEASIHCVTCGLETNVKSALKHMERCFSKVKKQC